MTYVGSRIVPPCYLRVITITLLKLCPANCSPKQLRSLRLASVLHISASTTDLYLYSPVDMSSTSHKSSEFSSEELYPLVTEVEENAPLKRKHNARAFYCLQLNFWTFITCVLAICLFTSMRRNQSQHDQYSYENGYDTEFRKYRNFFFMYILVTITLSPRLTRTPSNSTIGISSSCSTSD